MDALTAKAQEWAEAEARRSDLAKQLKDAKQEVADAKGETLALLDARGQQGVFVGDRRIKKTELVHAVLENREAFAEWAKGEDGEAFFEAEVRLIQDRLNQFVRDRLDNGEDPPPGVGIFIEEKLSNTKA